VFTAVPRANWYPLSVYEEKLRAAGFGDLETRSIGDHVYVPLVRFMRSQLDHGEVRNRVNRFFRPRWVRALMMNAEYLRRTHDYVIVRATRA
jgi:hypothetical protein